MSQGRPQPPLSYRLIKDASAQSETVGVLLLLAITVFGTTAIVTFGSQAMDDMERASDLQRTEHTMTLLDSRAAMVALGDSKMQNIDFSGSQTGSFQVEKDSGWIAVEHKNYSGSENTEEIFNESMGAVVYETKNTEIAYQGGGVWRVGEGGRAQMVSKPEFHYRDSTLTLPIIRMNGSGSAAGKVTASVTSANDTRRVFPNSSAEYDTVTESYTNPIRNGSVNVTVHSEYYAAWADYFRTRTTANVTQYDSNKTVHVQLKSVGDVGDFDTLSNTLGVEGYPEDHSLTNFTVTLEKDTGNWDNTHWSFYASKGSERFEIYISPNTNDCDDIDDGTTSTGTVYLNVFYENASSDQSQEWVNESISKKDGEFIVECDDDADELTVNLTARDVLLDYKPVSGSDISCSGNAEREFSDEYAACDGDAGTGTSNFVQHDADGAAVANPYVPSSGHRENVSFVNNHYFALLGPQFELKGRDGPAQSSSIKEDESYGSLSYDLGGGKFLTFLHITENEVEVELK